MKSHQIGFLVLLGMVLIVSVNSTMNMRRLTEDNDITPLVKEPIFVYERNSHYFAYVVYKSKESIFVQVLDKSGRESNLTFTK